MYVNKDVLCDLFQIEDIVVVDSQGGELVPDSEGKFSGLTSGVMYYVGSEKELDGEEQQVFICGVLWYFLGGCRSV